MILTVKAIQAEAHGFMTLSPLRILTTGKERQ